MIGPDRTRRTGYEESAVLQWLLYGSQDSGLLFRGLEDQDVYGIQSQVVSVEGIVVEEVFEDCGVV